MPIPSNPNRTPPPIPTGPTAVYTGEKPYGVSENPPNPVEAIYTKVGPKTPNDKPPALPPRAAAPSTKRSRLLTPQEQEALDARDAALAKAASEFKKTQHSNIATPSQSNSDGIYIPPQDAINGENPYNVMRHSVGPRERSGAMSKGLAAAMRQKLQAANNGVLPPLPPRNGGPSKGLTGPNQSGR